MPNFENFDFSKNYNKQSQGKNIYCRPRLGNDGNTGLTPVAAVKTLKQALSLATANQNDTVYLMAEGNSAANTTDYQSETLTWNKDGVHLIGVQAGQRLSHRARVGLISTYDTASNLFTLSANGCLIQNIEFFAGVAGTSPTGCMTVTGMRNHIKNCHIAGIGNDANDIASASSLYIWGNASENYFEECVIGCDTISRGSAASIYEINMLSATGTTPASTFGPLKPARNIFKGCYIIGLAGSTSQYFFLRVGSGGADRFVMFDDCAFINAATKVGGGASPAFAFSIATDANGVVVLKNTTVVGCDEIADNPGNVWSDMGLPTAADAGKMVVVTKS